MEVKISSFKNLAILIKRTRKMAVLSQNELADLAGVGKTLIFDLEKGHESIQFNNLKKILTVLNIQISFEPPSALVDSKVLAKKTKGKN